MAMDDKTVTAKVPAQQLDNGIEPAGSNISEEFYFGDDVTNIHKAQYDGFGPRYGMAPLPYHSIPVSTGQPSLVDLEVVAPSGESRSRVYGIVPLRLATYSATGPLGPSATHYAWITISKAPADNADALALHMNVTNGTLGQPYASGMDSRLSKFTQFGDGNFQWLIFLTSASTNQRRRLENWPNAWGSVSSFTVPGRVVSMQWLIGVVTAEATASVPPIIRLQDGYSSEFAFLNPKPGLRKITVYRHSTKGGQNITRTQYDVDATSSYYLFRNNLTKTTADMNAANLSFTTSRTYGTAGVYTNGIFTALYSDPLASHNQRHSVVAAAFGKPWGFVFKEELTSVATDGILPIILVDFTAFNYETVDRNTMGQGSANRYSENGSVKPTCWVYWPSWEINVPTANDAALACSTPNNNVALGPANSGILRANSTYEFTYTAYNKMLGHETNVGTPARIETGSDDFVCLLMRRSQTDTGASTGVNEAVIAQGANVPFGGATYRNVFEYRVYYRELGTFDWLPAGRIDEPRYFFDATERTWAVCEGAIAALPGGQPGGFVDNSPLPSDEYFQTFTYANRLFWCSPKSLLFSGRDNPYIYSVRNAFGCPKGAFLGGITHAYPGESEQSSRIVLFTTEATYTARFRGQEFGTQEPVRVSPTSVGTFYVDGSDFDIREWTSITAFSYRSAVNADGVLYWWGPQGVYRDDGVDVPSKGWSQYMDPLLKTLYDKAQSAKIHTVFNHNTHECIWFFLDTAGVQKALVYNTKADSFFMWSFSNILVDSSQLLDVEVSGSALRTLRGPRVLLHCRDASDLTIPQRTVFFDELVDAGDVRVTKAYLVTAVATSGANRELTLAAGFTGTVPTSGALTISGAKAYRGNTDAVDGIYAIVGGNGTSTIQISPIGGTWAGNDFTLGAIGASTNYFPVWVESVHGFALRAQSGYFAPMGWLFHGRWIYCQQLFKVDEMTRTTGYQVKMEWLTTAGGATPGVRTLTLADNYRGNYRVHSQIPFTQQNAEGQGISTTWTTPSGLHNGGRWFVQYLSFNIVPMSSGENRRYEG